MKRTENDLAYPGIKADLDLCYKQMFAICKGDRGPLAIMSVPPRPSDFDMQFSAAFDELKAYRDTGLTPEEVRRCLDFEDICGEEYIDFDRLRELAKADQEGQCVILPCKVGDTVYKIHTMLGCDDLDMPTTYKVYQTSFSMDDVNKIGKTMFLTREAAEAALKERENNE